MLKTTSGLRRHNLIVKFALKEKFFKNILQLFCYGRSISTVLSVLQQDCEAMNNFYKIRVSVLFGMRVIQITPDL